MRAFKSPMGIDFPALPLPATVLRLLLAAVAFALTAVIWLGAAQASRSRVADVSRILCPATAVDPVTTSRDSNPEDVGGPTIEGFVPLGLETALGWCLYLKNRCGPYGVQQASPGR